MDSDSQIKPVRYVFTAHKSPVILKTDKGFETIVRYIVDFEIACDLFDTKFVNEKTCVKNTHIINDREPWVYGDEGHIYVSHSAILSESEYETLKSFTNFNVLSRKYDGVVEGFSIESLKKLFPNNKYPETGVYIETEGMFRLRQPKCGFNETKHKRYIQASESFMLKHKKELCLSIDTGLYE